MKTSPTERSARRFIVGLLVLPVVAVVTIAAVASPGGSPAAAAGGGAWRPLGHGVWKRCDGHTAVYVYDATSSKGGIAVTSWSAECP